VFRFETASPQDAVVLPYPTLPIDPSNSGHRIKMLVPAQQP